MLDPDGNLYDPQTIYIRILNNATGCYDATETFNIIVNSTPESFPALMPEACDDTESGSDVDGSSKFDLTLLIPIKYLIYILGIKILFVKLYFFVISLIKLLALSKINVFRSEFILSKEPTRIERRGLLLKKDILSFINFQYKPSTISHQLSFL